MKKTIEVFGLCISLTVVSCKQKDATPLEKEKAKVEETKKFVPHIEQKAWYENDTFHLITYYQDLEGVFVNDVGVKITICFFVHDFIYSNTIKGDFDFIKNNKLKELEKAEKFMELKQSNDVKIDSQLKILNAAEINSVSSR